MGGEPTEVQPPTTETETPTEPEPVMNGEMKQDPDPTTEPTPVTEVELEPTAPATPESPEEEDSEPEKMEDLTPMEHEPPAPEPSTPALPEAQAREKAYTLVREELFPLYEERVYGKEKTWNPFTQKVKEFLDIDVLQIMPTIRDIHLQERPEDREATSKGRIDLMQLLAEYLCLTYQYPEESQEEIFTHFRQAARDGKTILRWFEAELALGIVDPRYIKAKDIAFEIADQWRMLLRQKHSGTLSDAEYNEALDKMYAQVTGLVDSPF